MKTKVYVRPLGKHVSVKISEKKPEISKEIKEKWQNITNIMAKILKVPAGLIMKITNDNMEIFMKSQNIENPYPENGKDSLLHGLYCETVIGTNDVLQVDFALDDPIWEDNPDVRLDMLSYLGLPLQWDDGEFFGTICILDSNKNQYGMLYIDLMKAFKNLIETDLRNAVLTKELEELSYVDPLTNLCNRRFLYIQLAAMFEGFKRYSHKFSTILIDINDFKMINDKYGHEVGDKVLCEFAKVLKHHSRVNDCAARYGGDEFILLLKETLEEDAILYMKKVEKELKRNELLAKYNVTISYGVVGIDKKYIDLDQVLKAADKLMYKDKKIKK